MAIDKLTLSAGCDRDLVATEVSSERVVEWTVRVPASGTAERAPINMALVLDRSGSMQGDKLAYVRQAAAHVLDLLDERDRVAVVTYDDQVASLAPSQRMDPDTRRALAERIRAIRTGGRTNLSGGWLQGCQEIAAHQREEYLNRALLMTDGLANEGITDVEELARHARELRLRGISTSTFGVGLDFNEEFLEMLADAGGGHFYYIERPRQIAAMFQREFGELLTVVAREAVLSVPIPKGVSVELLGDVPHERDGERLRIFLGDLYAGQQQMLYAKILTPPDMPGTKLVLRAELRYVNLEGSTETVAAEQWFSYAREAEVRLIPIDQALLARAGVVEMETASARALRLERAGRREEARALVQDALRLNAPRLAAEQAAQYASLAEEMGHGMDEDRRKQTHWVAYQRRRSRE
ncbi:MAG: VWA domain-containing protein [Chloroflexota bacterium]|nr:VWA domain-containing protein [Chloroflexota bacterium]